MMFGPPEDVEGECNERLSIGDDYGDNPTTFRCQRKPNHAGFHQEVFEHTEYRETKKDEEIEKKELKVVVQWSSGDKEPKSIKDDSS